MPPLPRCYNRAPFADPSAGWQPTGRKVARWVRWPGACVGSGTMTIKQKPVLRYRWPWFADRCASYDAPNIKHSVPWVQRWRCHGCRLLPDAARYRAALIESSEQLAERVCRVLRSES